MGLSRETRIILLLVLDTIFFFLELIIGYTVHSLALVADSFHMLNDIISLFIALYAVKLAKKPAAKAEYTYGWKRAEILGALANGIFLIALCMSIFLEAINRFINPPEISNPKLVIIVGCAGLLSNIIGLFLFHEHGHSHSHSHDKKVEENPAGQLATSNDRTEQMAFKARDGKDTLAMNVIRQDIDDDAINSSDIEAVWPSSVVNKARQYSVSRQGCDEPNERSSLLRHGTDHTNHRHARSSSSDDLEATQKTKKKKRKIYNMNMHGVFLHVLGDALGNIGVIIAGLFIWLTHYHWRHYSDPMVSVIITFIILASAIPLCKNAALILLQVAPHSIEIDAVKEDIQNVPGVVNVHELHIWQLSETYSIATVHVLIDLETSDTGENYMNLTASIRDCLLSHGVKSCTIQPEFKDIVPVIENGQCILRRKPSNVSQDDQKCALDCACE